jgi:hypothetical protein
MDETGKLPSSEETETTFRPGDLVNREAISFSEDKKSDEESQEPSATVTSAQPKPINPRAIIINPAQVYDNAIYVTCQNCNRVSKH